jgi:hypothetical protein
LQPFLKILIIRKLLNVKKIGAKSLSRQNCGYSNKTKERLKKYLSIVNKIMNFETYLQSYEFCQFCFLKINNVLFSFSCFKVALGMKKRLGFRVETFFVFLQVLEKLFYTFLYNFFAFGINKQKLLFFTKLYVNFLIKD